MAYLSFCRLGLKPNTEFLLSTKCLDLATWICLGIQPRHDPVASAKVFIAERPALTPTAIAAGSAIVRSIVVCYIGVPYTETESKRLEDYPSTTTLVYHSSIFDSEHLHVTGHGTESVSQSRLESWRTLFPMIFFDSIEAKTNKKRLCDSVTDLSSQHGYQRSSEAPVG